MTETAEPTLAAFVADGWQRHAEAPQAVAAELMARAVTLPADADAAGALRLAEHIWLSHLHDAAGLRGFVQALSAPARATDAARRAQWALAVLAGDEPPAIADAARLGALQGVWSLRVASGHAAAVQPSSPSNAPPRWPTPTPPRARPWPSPPTTWPWTCAKARAATPRAMH